MNQLYFPGRVVDLYSEDYQYLQDNVSTEVLKILKSIVSGELSSSIIKNFVLRVDPSNNLYLEVTQNSGTGLVITNSGLLIEYNSDISSIAVSDATYGTVNNVYAKCSYVYGSYNRKTETIVEGEKKAVDLYDGTLIYNRKIEDLEIVVYTVAEYNALTAAQKAELVFLGSTIAQGSGNPLLSVDLSSVTYFAIDVVESEIPAGAEDDEFYGTADNLEEELNRIRTEIRNIKQSPDWDTYQIGISASDPDMNKLHLSGVAPNVYEQFDYELTSSGTAIRIKTGKAIVNGATVITYSNTDFNIVEQGQVYIGNYTARTNPETHIVGNTQPVTFTLAYSPVSNVHLIEQSSGNAFIEGVDYTINTSTGEVTTIVGGNIMNETVDCYYSYPGNRCDLIGVNNSELVYEIGTGDPAETSSVLRVTSTGILPLWILYLQSGETSLIDARVIDARTYLQPVKETRQLDYSTISLYPTDGKISFTDSTTGAISSTGYTITSTGITSSGIYSYVTVTNSVDLTAYMFTKENDFVWILCRPVVTTMYPAVDDTVYLTLHYETSPGSGTLDGSSTIKLPTTTFASNIFIPLLFKDTEIADGITRFKISISRGSQFDFSCILIGNSDLFYQSSLIEGLLSNLEAYVNRGDISTSIFSNIFIGPMSFISNISSIHNIAIGPASLTANTFGNKNIGLGASTLMANTFGSNNIAMGFQALGANISGDSNIAIGPSTISLGENASYNIAMGDEALRNCGGDATQNIALGYRAMRSNYSGRFNVAIGNSALYYNTYGSHNVAIGSNALERLAYNGSTDRYNVAIGSSALGLHNEGDLNTAVGYVSLYSHTTGNYNTAIGSYSLYSSQSTQGSIGIGYYAGYYNTSSNKLFVHNQDTGSLSGDLSRSLIVGTFDSVSANQNVTINGSLNVGHNVSIAGGLEVDRINWTFFSLIARELTISGNVAYPGLCALNGTDVALIDSNMDRLRRFRFDGLTWTSIGSELNIAPSAEAYICSLNETDVAACDYTFGIRTYRFTGTTWTTVGTTLSISGGLGHSAICSLNATDIAITDAVSNSLRTFRFNGTTWTSVGNPLVVASGVPAFALCSLNNNTVVLANSDSNNIGAYRFNGTTWTSIGSQFAVSGGITTPALCSLNATDVVFIDNAVVDYLQVFRFNETTWTSVGSKFMVTGGGNPALCSLNGTDIAFIDDNNDKLRVYRLNYTVSAPYRWW